MNQADKVYHELLEHTLKLLKKTNSFEMVAAALMSIAQRLYRTNLNEEDYHRIMKAAYEIHVEPYDLKDGTLH